MKSKELETLKTTLTNTIVLHRIDKDDRLRGGEEGLVQDVRIHTLENVLLEIQKIENEV